MEESLSIFDLGVKDVEKKEVTVPSKAVSKTASPKPAPKPKEEVKVTDEWTIHFATESFNVSDFVDEIPEEGVTLEVLRAEMEKVYFQFTATRTKWDIDKDNKRLFPDATGAAKGAIRCP
ncbi:hypothetical protein [Bacillus sp. FJAT-29937]|uniref:hypothetical protein n=1 Tax=Bacillus sp. FJAT-29937 TaxID=1720553 RepID=UPI00082B0BB0|nr:hypothetical protein [Bacillus sp. FJAT-29937]